ncbi:MAG: hypothetical protein GHCLOJNM_03566 [bacterium]|nr:hypothetical protein [bacterium]
MKTSIFCLTIVLPLTAICVCAEPTLPGPFEGGYLLPNGWRITPIGKTVHTEDLITNLLPSPDGKVVVALTSGYNPHGLVVIDSQTDTVTQRIPQPTSFFGMAWSTDGKELFVSGGNTKAENSPCAPIYVYGYSEGRLTEQPLRRLQAEIPREKVYWSGVAVHPKEPLLYAANRILEEITLFNTESGKIVGAIPTEKTPYDLVFSPDGSTLYGSNWASDSVSVIDTESGKTRSIIAVGDNPNDLAPARDGRLFVACANSNWVDVIDTEKGRAVGRIVTSLHPRAPEGSTPNALALDPEEKTLYVANADNNNVCVVDIEESEETDVLGFLPAGWYPSALAVSGASGKLYIGNAKGVASYGTPKGPHVPLAEGEKTVTVKSGQKGAVTLVDIRANRENLPALTRQVYENCPYTDELLAAAKPPRQGPSVVPSAVGAGSAVEHVIYIIKENRTYDQVFGDLPQGNGDPNLCLFGREVTPNHHALAEQFVLLDNLYCDAEVSADGHQWSNAAYATDYVEKNWPAGYGGKSDSPRSPAMIPAAGYIWDQCARKGLTYRSYGEFASRQSEKEDMSPTHPALVALHGHVAPKYLSWGARDTENAAEFLREFEEYEKNFEDPDPEKRLPNFIVMALPEDHTRGTRPGEPTPKAAVACNDYALGMIIDRLSRSRYWPTLAVFVIEDDAQDGPDHVDARRTVGFVLSPYSRLGVVDSTLYTTSSMLRTIELLLGLQPMSQFDAAATPMYAALADTANLEPYTHIPPKIDINERNAKTAWGAEKSMEIDLSDYDRAPMYALNEILWKSIKGADSEMPPPIHRFRGATSD